RRRPGARRHLLPSGPLRPGGDARVRGRRRPGTGPGMNGGVRLLLALPFRGRWKVQNAPADRVPSHGTGRFALSYSIDLVPVDERCLTAPFRLGRLLRPESQEAFPGFGRELRSTVDGEVHSAHDGED